MVVCKLGVYENVSYPRKYYIIYDNGMARPPASKSQERVALSPRKPEMALLSNPYKIVYY